MADFCVHESDERNNYMSDLRYSEAISEEEFQLYCQQGISYLDSVEFQALLDREDAAPKTAKIIWIHGGEDMYCPSESVECNKYMRDLYSKEAITKEEFVLFYYMGMSYRSSKEYQDLLDKEQPKAAQHTPDDPIRFGSQILFREDEVDWKSESCDDTTLMTHTSRSPSPTSRAPSYCLDENEHGIEFEYDAFDAFNKTAAAESPPAMTPPSTPPPCTHASQSDSLAAALPAMRMQPKPVLVPRAASRPPLENPKNYKKDCPLPQARRLPCSNSRKYDSQSPPPPYWCAAPVTHKKKTRSLSPSTSTPNKVVKLAPWRSPPHTAYVIPTKKPKPTPSKVKTVPTPSTKATPSRKKPGS
eukprot:TRINITY_DN28157_c0_g1_i1.p1 TRINITY_DN28157_c0_g1~~TRINITY_DN28157_c0_g1_i1.p1  ORF type:complete len:358 (-),score=88.76 TRINITY_DN28157_c0_g1_i1:455-1528(-)